MLNIQHTGSPGLTAASFEQVTVSTSAVGLLGAVPQGVRPKRAWITVHDEAIRYRYDGIDPDGSTGHEQIAGTLELIGYERIAAFRMISGTANPAEVAVTLEV